MLCMINAGQSDHGVGRAVQDRVVMEWDVLRSKDHGLGSAVFFLCSMK